jgi:hypothetical protein
LTNRELIELLGCDKSWPVCLFDFTYKNKIPEFFVFRTDSRSIEIKENYFYNEYTSLTSSVQTEREIKAGKGLGQ